MDQTSHRSRVHPFGAYALRGKEEGLELGDFTYVWCANEKRGLRISPFCIRTMWMSP